MDRPLRVVLLTVGDPGRMTGGYLFHRRLAAAAAANGARVAFVSIPAWPLPWAILAGVAWRRSAAIGEADVVVLDSLAASAAAPWLAGRRGVGAPIVAILHQPPGGFGRPLVRRRLLAPFDRWAYRACARLLPASGWLAAELRVQGFDPGRIRVLPPGKDVAGLAGDARTDAAAGESPEPATLRAGRRAAALCVASWLPSKGILELLAALARLPDDRLTLHLVGDTRPDPGYARRVRARIARPDLRGRVVVHGVLPPARVHALYSAADLLALPSFEETYGTAWGEAMAAGLPVVGWRAGNLPYLADEGREALMPPPGDVPGLGAALDRLATEVDLRRRMGLAAAERARERPTWDEVARSFYGELRAVVAGISATREAWPAGQASVAL